MNHWNCKIFILLYCLSKVLPLELLILVHSASFYTVTCAYKKAYLGNFHRPLIPYYCRNIPVTYYNYDGQPNFILKKTTNCFLIVFMSFVSTYTKHIITYECDKLLHELIFAVCCNWNAPYTSSKFIKTRAICLLPCTNSDV